MCHWNSIQLLQHKYRIQWCSPNSNIALLASSISKSLSIPKRTFNINYVPLIASSPTSKEISWKCDLLLREHHCTCIQF